MKSPHDGWTPQVQEQEQPQPQPQPPTKPWNQPLFDHMIETHGLILTESEMNDILDVAMKVLPARNFQVQISPEMIQLLERLQGRPGDKPAA